MTSAGDSRRLDEILFELEAAEREGILDDLRTKLEDAMDFKKDEMERAKALVDANGMAGDIHFAALQRKEQSGIIPDALEDPRQALERLHCAAPLVGGTAPPKKAKRKKAKRKRQPKAPNKNRKTRAVSLADVRRTFSAQDLDRMGREALAAVAEVEWGGSERSYTFGIPGSTYTIPADASALKDFLWRIGELPAEAPKPAAAATEAPAAEDPPQVTRAGPSLDLFAQTLREYQLDVVADAMQFVGAAEALATRGADYSGAVHSRRLYSSPTGTGKGTIELALLKELRAAGHNAWILTPSLEVLRGFLERCGAGDLSTVNADGLAALGEAINVTTPTRFRNRVLDGSKGSPDVVIYDEVHHATEKNVVSGTLFAVAPDAVWLGFTATPYRGSPKATKDLRDAWGETTLVMTIPEAVADGWMALPVFSICPLLDDDEIRVRAGEFAVRGVSAAWKTRIGSLADLVQEKTQPPQRVESDSKMRERERSGAVDRVPVPTCITVPSSEVAGMLVEALDERGIIARWIHQATSAQDRQLAYTECAAGRCVLVSIAVISEGFDAPWLRRIISAKPTMSPVCFVQQLGRICRPGDIRPEYIETTRNIERHSYLLQGAIPRSVVAAAQDAFEKPSKRAASRSIGLEALRRFKPISLPLLGGVSGTMFSLYSTDSDGLTTEWATLLDPCSDEPFCASRTIAPLAPGEERRGKASYGTWVQTEMPDSLTGFATSRHSGKLSEKQAAWWRSAAARYGLEPDAAETLTRRQFAALPVLKDTRRNLLEGSK